MNGRRGCSTVWPFDTVVGVCVLTPLYVLGSLFSVWFSRCFWGLGLFSGGFWVLFGTVLLLLCLNDLYKELDWCVRICGLAIQKAKAWVR